MRLTPVTQVSFGADPEGFFVRDGKVIGSERVIPAVSRLNDGQIVQDGVQFELQPFADWDRTRVLTRIGYLLAGTRAFANKVQADLSFDGLITVEQNELQSLSAGARVLGCQPSMNAYEEKPLTVDTETYPKRSAGGHIHIGMPHHIAIQNAPRLVPLMDVLVGNTGVLLDRDPGAAERRENYGRAGEYRTTPYGVEYRTLSNFWLRDPLLAGIVYDLTSTAASIYLQAQSGSNPIFWNEIAKNVDIARIREAIDTNNYDLALENFNKIAPALGRMCALQDGFTINSVTIPHLLALSRTIKAEGVATTFPYQNIHAHWKDSLYINTRLYTYK